MYGWLKDRKTSRQTEHTHVTPLTLCTMFSGWVMSHCFFLSFLQWATGQSDWPHSATITSPARLWSHTSHFTISLLQAIINLYNQHLLTSLSAEIYNDRHILQAATSSYEQELWCLLWLRCVLIGLNPGCNVESCVLCAQCTHGHHPNSALN